MTCGTHFQPPHARDRGHRNVNINIWLLLCNKDTYHVFFYLTGHVNSISKPNFQGTRKCNSLVFSESLYPGKSQFIAGFLSLSHHTSLLIRPLHLSTGCKFAHPPLSPETLDNIWKQFCLSHCEECDTGI